MRAICIQIAYYQHWERYGENDKVSKKEIDNIIRMGFNNCAEDIYDLVIKYNLTDADFIWDVLTIAFEIEDKAELVRRLKKPPFNIVIPHDNRYYCERFMEIEKIGLTITRKDAQQKREIRKEMGDAYINEGDDVWIKGEWVKTK
jgi:hypothetical protein